MWHEAGHKGRNFVLFRVRPGKHQRHIEVLRLLHDAMDLTRHISGAGIGKELKKQAGFKSFDSAAITALLPQCSGVCGGARAGELEVQQPHS
jgi:hypothetical protein